MRRSLYIIVLVLGVICGAVAGNKGRSQHVVYVDGVRYYVHEVVDGNTLYSLSKLYDVEEEDILAANPMVQAGLKLGQSIKIPNIDKVEEPKFSKRDRRLYNEHSVAKGETLYSISRQYELSVATILEDNPHLDPVALSIGDVIKIRKSELGMATESTTQSELNDYRQRLNSVVPSGYKYYIVSADDTLIGLAELADMSVGELRKINGMGRREELVAGNIIMIRDVDAVVEQSVEADDLECIDMEPSFAVLSADDTLHVTLMLPLQMRGYNMKPFVEFYNGFLLGIEDLRKAGHSVEVNLFNTGRSAERLEEILAELDSVRSDLIVGPVYEELLAGVLDFAELRNIPVVSPLVNLEYSDSPVLFQMAPYEPMQYDKIGELLSSDRTVTLIYGESNDTAYVSSVKRLLERDSIAYAEHNYKYEHVSVVNDRVEALEERIEKIEQRAIERGYIPDQRLIDSLHMLMVSSGDMGPVVANEAKRNTFFVMSNNEVEVDRILSAMVSVSTGRYVKRVVSAADSTKMVSVSVIPSKYEVVANPAWRRYKNIDHTIYFNSRVVNFSSYVAGRESEAIRDFDSRYAQAYDDIPSMYAYRGYDAIKIFGESAYDKIRYGLSGEEFAPLQTTYRFDLADTLSTRRVNTNWMRVNYSPNLKYEIE